MGVFTSGHQEAGHDGEAGGHEQVVFCQDKQSGLRAIIAIYSTALGPALGGTRFHPYVSEEAALADVLDLSKGDGVQERDRGPRPRRWQGGYLGRPGPDKSEALLRGYGRFVESLGGRYYTACDVGTYTPDMDVVARETRFVTGRSVEHGGCGDSSVLTAFGVFQGMRAAAEHVWGIADACRAPHRYRRARQGWQAPHRPTCSDDAAQVAATDIDRGRGTGYERHTRRSKWSPTRPRSSLRTSTFTRRVRLAEP